MLTGTDFAMQFYVSSLCFSVLYSTSIYLDDLCSNSRTLSVLIVCKYNSFSGRRLEKSNYPTCLCVFKQDNSFSGPRVRDLRKQWPGVPCFFRFFSLFFCGWACRVLYMLLCLRFWILNTLLCLRFVIILENSSCTEDCLPQYCLWTQRPGVPV